jgi:hypothetical protein
MRWIARSYQRVVRVIGGIHTILAEDDFIYRLNQDYLVTVEAIGASLRIYQDGSLVFEITDDSLDRGGIGLYCWGNNGARFSDVRLEDLGASATVAYKFGFTTSQFTNFFHHLHSFEDETWPVDLVANSPSDQELTSLTAARTARKRGLRNGEPRRVALATSVLGESGISAEPGSGYEADARRLSAVAARRSPEPIDWTRCDLAVSQLRVSRSQVALT